MKLRLFSSEKRCLGKILPGIFFLFSCCLFCLRIPVFAESLDEKELYSKSAVLMDGKTGRVLYEKNGSEILPMASTTKIMTCIIALENADLETEVQVSEYAASMPAVALGMREGENYKLKDLLYSLMLESHNDAAVAVAEGVSGNVEDFLELMNSKAKELGCENTVFLTPNGLDKSVSDAKGLKITHHTTAEELARIMCYCINESDKKEEFIEITGTKSYSFSDSSGKRNFNCNNHNAFLSMMEGALSGKTGFTNDAGYCYVGSLRKDNKDFVVALLACGWPNNKNYKWSDTKKLMTFGLENFSSKKITAPYKEVSFNVDGGQYDIELDDCAVAKAKADAATDSFIMLEDEPVVIVYEIMENIDAPVHEGEKIGEIKYYINDFEIYRGDISASESVLKKTYKWALKETLKIFF